MNLSAWSVRLILKYLKTRVFFDTILCFGLLNIGLMLSVQAQDSARVIRTLNISYFGKSVTRPGIKIGPDIVLLNLLPHNAKKVKSTVLQFVLLPNSGIYYHFHNHLGVLLTRSGLRATYSMDFYGNSLLEQDT
jgi:hypothetical protein